MIIDRTCGTTNIELRYEQRSMVNPRTNIAYTYDVEYEFCNACGTEWLDVGSIKTNELANANARKNANVVYILNQWLNQNL